MHQISKAFNSIHVLLHIPFRKLFHGVKQNVNSAFPRHLYDREEITVTSNKHDLVDKMILRERSYVEPNPHVNTLLFYIDTEISFNERRDFSVACKKICEYGIFKNKRSC